MKKKNSDTSRERLRGAIIGAVLGGAIGDALGMPLEGLTKEQILKRYGKVDYYQDGREGTGLARLKAGQYTDDTQIVEACIRAIVDYDSFHPENLSKEIHKMKGELRGMGRSTYATLKRLSKGVPWQEAGDPNGAGCGAITRVAPLAFHYLHVMHHCIDDIILKATSVTHRSETAGYSAILTQGIVDMLYDRRMYLDDMEERQRFAAGIAQITPEYTPELVTLKQNLAKVPIALEQGDQYAVSSIGVRGSIMEVLPTALYCFLKTPTEFRTSVIRAINLGGDTDSIGHLVGTFSGVYNGMNSLPHYLLAGLENRKHLEKLASRLWEKVAPRVCYP